MEKIKSGFYEFRKKKNQDGVIELIDTITNRVVYELVKPQKKKRKKNKKLGCLFTIFALFLSGDLDFDSGDKRINNLSLNSVDSNKEIAIIKRVRKGVEIWRDASLLGSIKFTKRELVAKYDMNVKDEFVGKLIPNGVSCKKIDLLNENKVLAKFSKNHSSRGERIGEFELLEDLSKDKFEVLMGMILLWV